MTWEQRLRDMLLAGGTLALMNCYSYTSPSAGDDASDESLVRYPFQCGNANPDPCICGRPEQSQAAFDLCEQQKACVAAGHDFIAYISVAADGTLIDPHCDAPGAIFPGDPDSGAGPGDAAVDDAGPE
jgi:hypothetical protein